MAMLVVVGDELSNIFAGCHHSESITGRKPKTFQESLLINFNTHYIVDLEFNNAEKIKKIDQPFLWMHGTADDYLKISNGEIIYRNYDGAYGEVHKVEGARHGAGGVPETLGFDEYLKIVEEFIVR